MRGLVLSKTPVHPSPGASEVSLAFALDLHAAQAPLWVTLSQLLSRSPGDLDESLVLYGTQFPHLSPKWLGLDQEPQITPLAASESSRKRC